MTESTLIENRFPAYSAYRASRMPWLSTVPEHWEENRGKFFFREADDRSKSGLEELLSVSHLTGVTPRSQKNVTMFKAESYIGHKVCQPGDVIVNTMWAWMGALGVARHIGIVSPAYGVYRPQQKDFFNPAYLGYLLRTPAYVSEYTCRSTGIRSSRLRLYPYSFLDIDYIRPPRNEQDQIVAYLRAQDAKIARFIRDKKRLIELLNEQKLALIQRAVTRGLDPGVGLKPSDVEWIGEVPEHWELKRLKQIAKVVLGKMLTLTAKGEGAFKPYLRSTNAQWLKPDVRDVREMWISQSEMTELRVRAGDLLVSEGGEVGRTSIWSDEIAECYIQNSVHRVVAGPAILARFLLMQFFVYGKRGRFESIVNKVSIAHLTREKLVDIVFSVPPIDEQKKLLEYLDTEIEPLDQAIKGAQSEIDLIHDYRERLITDVVTGQVDVRNWTPGPDDITDDDALTVLDDENNNEEESPDDDGYE